MLIPRRRADWGDRVPGVRQLSVQRPSEIRDTPHPCGRRGPPDQTERDARVLPSWYLDDGHVDYGYAFTGHKAQGVTTSRTFTVITGGSDREWAYVALSRGRQANTLYLANPEPGEEPRTHLTHPERGDPVDALVASLARRAAESAAIDQAIGPPPPSRDVADRAAWIIARRRAERDELGQTPRGIGLAAGR
ncbi:MAG: hypothetical protein U9O63_03665 [Actinomycetota bacterium]|nr:hypothetical protein [Actinomycetota bacterium]